MSNELVPVEVIENRIFLIRGHKVMLDKDLAFLYEVPTKALNQAVKRNLDRFPDDFMFLLSGQEKEELVTNCDRFKNLKHSTVNPLAFTEHGILMLSTVLNSERAVAVNIQIMRTFSKLRRMFFGYKELKEKIDQIESKYDGQFKEVFEVIKKLIDPPTEEERKLEVGFKPDSPS